MSAAVEQHGAVTFLHFGLDQTTIREIKNPLSQFLLLQKSLNRNIGGLKTGCASVWFEVLVFEKNH